MPHKKKKKKIATKHLNWLQIMYRNMFYQTPTGCVFAYKHIFCRLLCTLSYEFMVFIIIFEVDDLFEFVKQQHLRLMQFLAACAVIQNNNCLITVNLMC